MCHHQLHDDVAARSELAQGQKVVVEKDVPRKVALSNDKGFWFDCLTARILLDEATALIGSESESSPR